MPERIELLRRLESVIEETEFAWSLCIIGEDQSDKLAELTGDLKRGFSDSGDGKQIASGFSYWGIEPTIAWKAACNDNFYLVMKEGMDSFGRGWRTIKEQLGGVFHYFSLGPGTGDKDRIIVNDLYSRSPDMFYVPVDMSAEMLRLCLEPIRTLPFIRRFRSRMLPVQLDFNVEHNVKELDGLRQRLAGDEPVLFSMLGNTMANFEDDIELIAMLKEHLLRPQDFLLLEVATTSELDARAAAAAAQEYARISTFGKFVTSALHQSTDLSIDMDSVVCEGVVEDERSILVKVMYRNNTGRPVTMTLPDREQVAFPDGDTIRLYITRKYDRQSLVRLLGQVGLVAESEVYYSFRRSANRHRFGLALMVLQAGDAGRTFTPAKDLFREPRA